MSSELLKYAPAAAAAVGLAALIIAYRDYRAYVALGSHGLPDNFWGWKKQLMMTLMARKDTTVAAPYDIEGVKENYGPNATTSYFNTALEQRPGSRPQIPGFVAPQRQVTATASAKMKEQMFSYLKELTSENSSTLQSELSVLEGPVPAVQLKKGLDLPKYLEVTRGEMIHVHPADGSTHLILSLEDSRSVIERGWGQRHRLSGRWLGWGYTLVYAPRNQDEFELWKNVTCAAARYCCAEISEIRAPAVRQ
ncbi:hypothetical protein QQS21_000655 [Conoideocrella luteorostrata]|uniref:Luciferase domain-containing protein n=1 Tax=Conoideocrella luteorostrata TaxID=1105319 RepID=A0AAJ0CYP6_9HYPO|nr:hypothetical protein QQS21_000655 [Conoideocrella luteorostrata]